MHGEYKTPGGKLVAVDFEVADDRLVEVAVSGDFFLYPEEALADITGALEGLPADLTESEYAEKVRFALPLLLCSLKIGIFSMFVFVFSCTTTSTEAGNSTLPLTWSP